MRETLEAMDEDLFHPSREVRTWQEGPFELRLFFADTCDEMGKAEMGYLFAHDGVLIFAGNDLRCSPLHAVDSDETVASVLGFLSLEDGDTDADYFDHYSEGQIAWRDEHAETLNYYLFELEHPECPSCGNEPHGECTC